MDIQEVAIRTEAGTWHRGYLNTETDTLMTPEGCNLDDAERVETYPSLPDEALARDLCKRCHPIGTER